MKQCLLLYFMFICFFTYADNYREIDFSSNPFENLFPNEVFSSGGNAKWQWSKDSKAIFSGDTKKHQESWLDFTFFSLDGVVEVSFYVYTSKRGNALFLSLDGEVIGQYVNRQKYLLKIPCGNGKHTLRFSFAKKAYNVGYSKLTNIKYKPFVDEIISSEITHSDKKSNWSWGNQDGVGNSFEMLHVSLFLTTRQTIGNLSFQLYKPDNVYLILRNDTNKDYQIKENEPLKLDFSIMTDSLFKEEQIKLRLILKSHNTAIKTIDYNIPFVWLDHARSFLQEETVITSKKFDYTSEKELDLFLQKFPDSELAPVLFTLRFECCRNYRDEILKQVDSIDNRDEKEKKIIAAINHYIKFIELYPERVLTKIAIHEVFQLYVKINRISFYTNFIERFPQAEQSIIAQEHIKALLYQVTCAKDTIEAYDKFASMYPDISFHTLKCIDKAQQLAIVQEQYYLQKQVEKIVADKPHIKEILVNSQKNKRANLLIKDWLVLTNTFKNTENPFIVGIQINRTKKVIEEVYSDTDAISTLLIMEKLDDISNINKEILKLQQELHNATLAQMGEYFSELNKTLLDNFAQTNESVEELKVSLQGLEHNLKLMHQDINNQLTQIESQIAEGFNNVNLNLKEMEKNLVHEMNNGTVAKYLTLLHYNLDKINNNVIKVNTTVVDMSQENRAFLQQNAQILKHVQQNGQILNGWQKYKNNSSLHTAVSKTVVNALSEAVSLIPVVGSITNKVAAPIIKWIGDSSADAVVQLWESIF